MCTKYTPSHCSTYLTFYVRYTSSANCKTFLIVFYSRCKRFVDKLCLSTKLWNFNFPKIGQILYAHKPYFLMLGHNLRRTSYSFLFILAGYLIKLTDWKIRETLHILAKGLQVYCRYVWRRCCTILSI